MSNKMQINEKIKSLQPRNKRQSGSKPLINAIRQGVTYTKDYVTGNNDLYNKAGDVSRQLYQNVHNKFHTGAPEDPGNAGLWNINRKVDVSGGVPSYNSFIGNNEDSKAPKPVDFYNSDCILLKGPKDEDPKSIDKAMEIYERGDFSGRDVLCVIDGQLANIWGTRRIGKDGRAEKVSRGAGGQLGNDFIAVRKEDSDPSYYIHVPEKGPHAGEEVVMNSTYWRDTRPGHSGENGMTAKELYTHADYIYYLKPKEVDDDKVKTRRELRNKESSIITNPKLLTREFKMYTGNNLTDLVSNGVILDADVSKDNWNYDATFILGTEATVNYIAGKTGESRNKVKDDLMIIVKGAELHTQTTNIEIDDAAFVIRYEDLAGNGNSSKSKIFKIIDSDETLDKDSSIKKCLNNDVFKPLADACDSIQYYAEKVPKDTYKNVNPNYHRQPVYDKNTLKNQFSEEFFNKLKKDLIEGISKALDLADESLNEIYKEFNVSAGQQSEIKRIIDKRITPLKHTNLPDKKTQEDLDYMVEAIKEARRALAKVSVEINNFTYEEWKNNTLPTKDIYQGFQRKHGLALANLEKALNDLENARKGNKLIEDTLTSINHFTDNIKKILKDFGWKETEDMSKEEIAKMELGSPDVPGDEPAGGITPDWRKKVADSPYRLTDKNYKFPMPKKYKSESLEEGEDDMNFEDNEEEFEEPTPEQSMVQFIQMCWSQVSMLETPAYENLGALVDDLRDALYVAIGRAEKLIKDGDGTKDIGNVAPNKDYPVGLADEPGDGENDRDGKEVLTELGEGVETVEDKPEFQKELENGTGPLKNVLFGKKDEKEKGKEGNVSKALKDVEKYRKDNNADLLNPETKTEDLAEAFEQKRLAEDKKFRDNGEDIDMSYVSSVDFNF